MLRQPSRAAASVNICILCTEPKVSAPLTYFQLNAQILHRFSKARFRLAVAPHLSMELSRQARLLLAALSRPHRTSGSSVSACRCVSRFGQHAGTHVRADRFQVNVAIYCRRLRTNSSAAPKVVTAVVYFANRGFTAIAGESKCDSKDRDRQRQRCRLN
jgi:hypothetical protein